MGPHADRRKPVAEKNGVMPHPEETTIWPGHDYGETPAREMGENIYITDLILDGEKRPLCNFKIKCDI